MQLKPEQNVPIESHSANGVGVLTKCVNLRIIGRLEKSVRSAFVTDRRLRRRVVGRKDERPWNRADLRAFLARGRMTDRPNPQIPHVPFPCSSRACRPAWARG